MILRRVVGLITVVSFCSSSLVGGQPAADGNTIQANVNRILEDGALQSRDKVEALRELGPDCVPVVLARLERTGIDEPHATLVGALGAIGDARATGPLLARLGSMAPLDDPGGEYAAKAVVTINAIRDIGDPAAASTLGNILGSEKAAVGTRIAAAHALLVLGDEYDHTAAAVFLYAVDDETVRGGQHAGVHTEGPFDPRQLACAIAAIDTEESRKVLVRRLYRSGMSYEEETIIDLLATRVGQEEVAALLKVVEHDEYEWHVRMKATNVLLQHYTEVPSEILRTSFLKTLDGMESPPTTGVFRELINRAKMTLGAESSQ